MVQAEGQVERLSRGPRSHCMPAARGVQSGTHRREIAKRRPLDALHDACMPAAAPFCAAHAWCLSGRRISLSPSRCVGSRGSPGDGIPPSVLRRFV
mmetsp:Transcript_18106/g.41505  ORF Transcript_18106/g.41505 Transcript_18106/m.41505 type:complete len:96 (+) Transcript_18106:109-396(+)